MSVFTVCVCAAGLVSTVGLARAVTEPGNDAIATATPIAMSGETATFRSFPSDAGATAADDAADGQLTTNTTTGGGLAQHTLWYKFQPSPGLVSVSVTSSEIAKIVAGVVTTNADDSDINGLSDTFSLVSDASVKNSDGDPDDTGSALVHTTSKNQTQTFSFTADAALVPDADHDYYLGVGSVGATDADAPTGGFTISTAYTEAPLNDDFATAAVITPATKTYLGDTTAATPDLDGAGHNIDPVVAGQSGMFSVWYAFTAPRNGRVALSTLGSSFPVVFEVCQSPVAVPSDCDNSDVVDSGVGATPITSTSFDAQDGETYYLFLDGQQVTGQAYNAAGPYKVRFVFSPASPNDDISMPTVLNPAGVVRVTGSNVGAQAVVLGNNPPATTTPESSHGLSFDGGGQQHSVWYRYKPKRSAHMVLYTTGSLNTDVEMFRGSLASGFTDTNVGNDDYSVHSRLSRFPLSVRSGGIYYIGVDGSTEASYPEGSFGLDLGAVPSNDNIKGASLLAKTKGKVGKNRTTVSKGAGKVKGSTAFATFQKREKSPKHFSGGADVWYKFIAPKAGSYTFTESLRGAPALIAAYSGKGSSNLGLKLVKDAAHPRSTKAMSKIKIKARAGQKFEISVDGSAGAFGSYILSWK
jgi:hypothetical protein